MADSYIVTNIGPGFWAIADGGVRMFLFDGEDCALLVDTGFGSGDLPGLVESLVGKKPIRVFITHGHYDHVQGCSAFSSFYAHEGDMDQLLAASGPDANIITVDEGDIIDIGTRQFEVCHFPGHTPGGIGLYDRDRKMLISGDNVSSRPIYMFLAGANIDLYADTLCRIALLLGEEGKIYACHGELEHGVSSVEKLITLCGCIRAGLLEKGVHTLPSGDTTSVFRYRDVALLYGG